MSMTAYPGSQNCRGKINWDQDPFERCTGVIQDKNEGTAKLSSNRIIVAVYQFPEVASEESPKL